MRAVVIRAARPLTHLRTHLLTHWFKMARDDREMTFIWIPHGRDPGSTRSYELSYRRARAWGVGAAVLAFVLLLMAGSWLWLAAQAARVPGLTSEVRELRQDRVRVRELAQTVERLSAEYAKVRSMLGADSASLPAFENVAPAADGAAADSAGDAEGDQRRGLALPCPTAGRWRRGAS